MEVCLKPNIPYITNAVLTHPPPQKKKTIVGNQSLDAL
jgi:hypothetical protein